MTFHFAWVDPGETSFTTEFEREDEEVLSFEITHDEGDFASLHLEIRNPRVGLLSVGRKRWAWLSFDDGSGAVPLFFGRLIGLPEEMSDEVVALSFIAKPLNYQTTKAALAMTMRQPEYYDPMFIQKERREEPDTVLEARPMVWCIDRVSHAVTASHVIAGEDGTIDFGGNVFVDSVKCGYTGAPQRKVIIQAEVRWGQYGLGSFTVHYDRIKTYTGDGLLSDWPKVGQRIGAGWSVKSAFAKDLYSNLSTTTLKNDLRDYWFYRWAIRGDVEVQYEAKRDYVETAVFTMQSDVQEIVTEAGDEEVLILQISGDADEAVDVGDMPIGDLRRRAYFPTDRGARSIKYIANVSAARLLGSARCAEVSFEVPFSYAPELSLRKSGTIADPRLPGGTATGKIKSYSISADGSSGALVCRVTLGCTPGNGGALSISEGTPSYGSDDYVDGYQTHDGATSAAVMDAAGDPIFTIAAYDAVPVQDDGLDLFNMTEATCVLENRIDYLANEQKPHLTGLYDDVVAWIKAHPTHVTLRLRPATGGPFTTPYEITASTLVVPKTIDLEASSS